MTPKYDLVQIEGAVHEPTFKYRKLIAASNIEFKDLEKSLKPKYLARTYEKT